jgi:galactose mutarotase-like enzyme
MTAPVTIGGRPIVTLSAEHAPASGPAILQAEVLPGRGMMLLQARVRLASGKLVDALHAPQPAEAAKALDGGPDDFNGDKSFSFGGAVLAPYANRIRGRPLSEAREIETQVAGRTVRLPRNWGGKAKGAEQYAMHGLILDAEVPFRQPAPDRVAGRLDAGDFGGRWPGRLAFEFEWRLAGGGLELSVTARNTGDEPAPLGLGWHPYFALPSGDRRQARLRLAAGARAEVNDYDEVLPTGRLLPVAGSAYDFSGPDGAALGETYLDDCFTDLPRPHGRISVDVIDPAADYALQIVSHCPQVKAVQVYAPPDQAFVVVEPQFNLADPFGREWPPGVDTGMARLQPGESLTYDVRVDASAVGNRR